MLWGIEYIVCMCIIIDTILILEMIVWVPRVYLVGGWAAIILSIWGGWVIVWMCLRILI